MIRLTAVIACALAVSLIAVRSDASTDTKKEKPRKAATGAEMKKKLDYSKNILDGLVTEDFAKILKNAKALNDLGERRWREIQSANYRTQNHVFLFTASSLMASAEKKNIDGATLAFTQMTVSCVQCHKAIRD